MEGFSDQRALRSDIVFRVQGLSKAFGRLERVGQDRAKIAQDWPKMVQDRFKTRPRWPKKRPRQPKTGPQ